MERSSKIDKIIESLKFSEDKHAKDLKVTKRYEVEFKDTNYKKCFNCGDEYNNYMLRSQPWTSAQYCWKCNHINVVSHHDYMGGEGKEHITCYSE